MSHLNELETKMLVACAEADQLRIDVVDIKSLIVIVHVCAEVAYAALALPETDAEFSDRCGLPHPGHQVPDGICGCIYQLGHADNHMCNHAGRWS